ncbi:MAG: dipeptide/oligopeptide/nickel ABC transporter ATP-binding protein [Zetaproteobacteria bacterium CG2_30_46_52]|nr:MAG: dipeptide/oligopeptide/nickel ABC transporter ATP-binding protein [Zetaproteobacteria bacterium CG2_30_46_52]
MLEVRDLSLTVPLQGTATLAVSNLSLQLQAGKVLALVGESGCGKSLTAQSMLRLGEYQGVGKASGDILLHGQSLFSMPDKQLRQVRGGSIAMIFQEPMTALNPVFSIGSQILEVIQLHTDLSPEQASARALALLADVGLQEGASLMQQYPDALSGGMRQRILIAMAMAGNPEFIIADEPTTALDVSVQKRIIGLLRTLQQDKGLGMLLVTHDFGLVAEMADEVAVMYAGEIIEQGSVFEIFDHPAHPYTKALMNCRPEAVTDGGALTVIPGKVPAPGSWGQGCRFKSRCTFGTDVCDKHVALDEWQQGSHMVRCVHVMDAKS